MLWRQGSSGVLRGADRLGFQEGARWDEPSVGTNAIGTALVVRRPVQVFASEHYVKTHHPWTCAAAPLHDPRDGALLGVLDVSGPAATVHASTVALVDAVARLAETQLRANHYAELDRVRMVAAPMMAKLTGPALATDRHGWVAAATGTAPVDRIALPERVGDGRVWLPAFGNCGLEPIPGGWLVHLDQDEALAPTRVEIDLRRPGRPRLRVSSATDEWSYNLSPRHADILAVLAAHRSGRSAAELAGDLFGSNANTVTVRAEMSRLRRHLGGILDHRPYRFADAIDVTVLRV